MSLFVIRCIEVRYCPPPRSSSLCKLKVDFKSPPAPIFAIFFKTFHLFVFALILLLIYNFLFTFDILAQHFYEILSIISMNMKNNKNIQVSRLIDLALVLAMILETFSIFLNLIM